MSVARTVIEPLDESSHATRLQHVPDERTLRQVPVFVVLYVSVRGA